MTEADARTAILARLSNRLRAAKAAPMPHYPAANLPDNQQLIDSFEQQLTRAHAQVERVHQSDLKQLPALLREKMLEKNILYVGDNGCLKDLPWEQQGLQLTEEYFTADDQWAISTAECGIAETGTLVLLSGTANPTRNNYLAAHHVVLIKAEDIFATSVMAWEYLQHQYSPLPRAVNFISGPSSSADVGLKLEYGAHGPRHLLVYLISGNGE